MSRKDVLNILILGGGGREHAIGWKVKQSPRCGELYFLPGNAGTAELGKNIPFLPPDWKALPDLVRAFGIDLVIIGPEVLLEQGVADILRAAGIAVVGPTQKAAQLETSKVFTKMLMHDAGIPTASFNVFKDVIRAINYVDACTLPVFVKASGLCGGKGAVRCHTRDEAREAVWNMMMRHTLGFAGDEIVIEQALEGEKISVHAFCDLSGTRFALPTQDYKRLLADGDTRSDGANPNTGGMGAIGPVPWMTTKQMVAIDNTIVEPVEREMRRRGIPYTGILYPGLMMTSSGPQVLEFNVRFGDPEAQVLMRLMKSDAVDLFEALAHNRIDNGPVLWHENLFAACIVLAARGYPEKPQKGAFIIGIEEAEEIPDVKVFHAGTRTHLGFLTVDGGRVLNVTATGTTLEEALAKAYRAVDEIEFDGMQYRKDIGRKAAPRRMEATLASV